ncbi:hypothetical protein CBL_04900 [Carabus blaptoides fortunei]
MSIAYEDEHSGDAARIPMRPLWFGSSCKRRAPLAPLQAPASGAKHYIAHWPRDVQPPAKLTQKSTDAELPAAALGLMALSQGEPRVVDPPPTGGTTTWQQRTQGHADRPPGYLFDYFGLLPATC